MKIIPNVFSVLGVVFCIAIVIYMWRNRKTLFIDENEINVIIQKKKSRLKLIASNGKTVESSAEPCNDDYYYAVTQNITGSAWENVKKLAATRGINELEAWGQIIENGMAVMTAADDGKDVMVDGKQYFP